MSNDKGSSVQPWESMLFSMLRALMRLVRWLTHHHDQMSCMSSHESRWTNYLIQWNLYTCTTAVVMYNIEYTVTKQMHSICTYWFNTLGDITFTWRIIGDTNLVSKYCLINYRFVFEIMICHWSKSTNLKPLVSKYLFVLLPFFCIVGNF